MALNMLGRLACTLTLVSLTPFVSAETVTVEVTPAADGVLRDVRFDGEIDEVHPDMVEATVGNRFGRWEKFCIEFALPDVPADRTVRVTSAELLLTANGEPAHYGPTGPNVDLWAYTGEQADGRISSLDDEVGERVGVFIEEDAELDAGEVQAMDVTDAVQAALEDREGFIGFRLESADALPEGNRPTAWRWRTVIFGQMHGEAYKPRLKLSYELQPADAAQ